MISAALARTNGGRREGQGDAFFRQTDADGPCAPTLRRRGGRKLVVSPDGAICLLRGARIDNALLKALARAHRWQRLIEVGTYANMSEIARAEDINDSYVRRLLRLTLLAPDIVEAILDGWNARGLQIERLLKPLPVEWVRQREQVGGAD